jgi:hypothetical protein
MLYFSSRNNSSPAPFELLFSRLLNSLRVIKTALDHYDQAYFWILRLLNALRFVQCIYSCFEHFSSGATFLPREDTCELQSGDQREWTMQIITVAQ